MADGGGEESMDTLQSYNHNGGKLECPSLDGVNSQESLSSSVQANSLTSDVTLNGPDRVQVKEEPLSASTISPAPDPGTQSLVVAEETSVASRSLKTEGVPTSLTSTVVPPASHSTPDVPLGGATTTAVPPVSRSTTDVSLGVTSIAGSSAPHSTPDVSSGGVTVALDLQGNGSLLSTIPSTSAEVSQAVTLSTCSVTPMLTTPTPLTTSSSHLAATTSSASTPDTRLVVDGILSLNSETRSNMSARISNHAQELAKQALNQVIQQKGLDKDMIWELVSKLKRFLNNLIQMASKKGATVKQAVESNVSKLMYNQINEEAFVTNLERILNSSHQDVLLPFLKESVPYLRLFIYQKQQCERYIQSAMSRQVTQQTQQGQQVQGQPSAVADGQEQSGQVVQGGGSSNGVAVKKDLTNQTPPPGLSLPPEVLLRMKQASLAAASQSTSRQGPSGPGASSGNQLSMPGFVDTNKGTSSLAEKVRAAKMVTKSPSKSKSGGKAKTDKSGSSATPINADDDDDDEEEIAGIDLKEETAHFLPSVGVAVASGHCEDETLIPVDLLKRRIARTATKKGIGEVTDEVVTLLSHAVQERLKFVLEKLTLICSHRMQSLKDQDSLSSLSNVKEQLKFLEGIDRCSAQRKQDLEREKVLKAAKSRNKDDPEVARMKEQAKMLQLEKEEEIRKRAANETALAAIQGTRKRPFQADSPVPGSSTLGKGVGDSAGGGAFGTPMGPPRQKQKRRINIRDLIFFLEQEKRSRKSLLLHKSLTK